MLKTYSAQSIKKGIQYAVDSFNIIWRNKQILLYLSIPTLISILLFLGFYNVMLFEVKATGEEYTGMLSGFVGIIEQFIHAPGWLHYIAKIIFLYATLFTTILFDGALIWHTQKIRTMNHETIMTSIRQSSKHYSIMSLWAFISMLEIIIQQKRTEFFAVSSYWFISPLYLISLALTLAWALFTFFVIQIIILEHYTTIIEIILRSGIAAKNLFFIIIGGELWLGLLTLCIIGIPALIIATQSFSPLPLAISIFVILGVKTVLSTVQTVFKTVVYKSSFFNHQ